MAPGKPMASRPVHLFVTDLLSLLEDFRLLPGA
jgi:hypothetical protein